MAELPPYLLPAHEAARLIRERELTSEELVTSCLGRIEAVDPGIDAWAHIDPELALKSARKRDESPPLSAIHGVPVGLKDVIDTAAMPTQFGSPIYAGRQPLEDAATVRLLDRAGAVVLGKTVTTELATWHPGKTSNPHDHERTPGGSSSGSAAAVAAAMVPLALGTQTVGSTIRPAAFCGVLGMKPTLDVIPFHGIRRTSRRLDTVGLFSRHPGDLRALLTVLGEFEPVSSGPPLRLGIVRTPWWEQAEDDGRGAFDHAAASLKAAGIATREIELPAVLAELPVAHDIVATVDIAAHCGREYDEHAELLSEKLRGEIERGRDIGAERYRWALEVSDSCLDALQSTMTKCDAILVPAVTGPAPRGLDWTGDPIFCRAWSMLGTPALTVPAASTEDGIPIGVQIVGQRGRDGVVLDAAEALVEALGGATVAVAPADLSR
jgi:amidase